MGEKSIRIAKIREKASLVHCITNVVTVNDCANVVLAAGARPVMASDAREVAEMVRFAKALVLNLGAIDRFDAMRKAGKEANRLGIPVVLDPVGCGSTALRNDALLTLLQEVTPALIRGNASEIGYLLDSTERGSGVDVSGKDIVTRENLEETGKKITALAKRLGCVVIQTGAWDLVSDGTCGFYALHRGSAVMEEITGSGCMHSCLLGSVLAVYPDEALTSALFATAWMSLAGEKAKALMDRKKSGNATFRTDLIDSIYLTDDTEMEEWGYEVFKGGCA